MASCRRLGVSADSGNASSSLKAIRLVYSAIRSENGADNERSSSLFLPVKPTLN